VHNWKRDWHITYGPEGDKYTTDIYCMPLKDFTAALKPAGT